MKGIIDYILKIYSINKYYFFLIAIITIGVRIFFLLLLLDAKSFTFLWFIHTDNISLTYTIVRYFTGIVLFLSVLLYVFKLYGNTDKITCCNTDEQYKLFIREIKWLITIVSFGILLNIFLSFQFIEYVIKLGSATVNRPANHLSLIINEIYSLYWFTSVALIGSFLFKWQMFYRYNRTIKYISIIAFFTFYFVISEFIQISFSFSRHPLIVASNFLMFMAMGLILWIMTNKNSWILYLPRKRKISLIFLTFTAVFFSIIILSTGFEESSKIYKSLNHLLPGASNFAAISIFMFGVYSLKIFSSTFSALPTTEIVERRNSEISSLAFLNNYIAASIDKDFNYLLTTVTNLARNSCGAAIAWTEIYEKDRITIASTVNVSDEIIYKLHHNGNIKNYFLQKNEPYLAESVNEDPNINYMPFLLPQAMSIIIIPLYSGIERIGTLVVGTDEEYGFEQHELKVLGAFSDNLRIAFENARLVRESIEKERFRRELVIAKEMQNKLLPTSLPEVDNFSMSAFSIPATEVGGDYYDIVYLPNNNPCILIADVSGKGMSAAFYMAQLKGIVMALSKTCSTPLELIQNVNSILYKSMPKEMFITMSAVSIQPNTGKISLVRAGHMPFFVTQNSKLLQLVPKGLGVGIASSEMFNKNIEQIDLKLYPGDTCVMFTDGINELVGENKAEFGYQPMIDLLNDESIETADNYTTEISKSLKSFINGGLQHDDLTMFCIKFQDNLKEKK